MELTTTFAALVPIVIGLVSGIKAFGLDSKYAPAVAVVLGILGTVAFGHVDVLQGILVGLTASGLYSGVKTSASIAS